MAVKRGSLKHVHRILATLELKRPCCGVIEIKLIFSPYLLLKHVSIVHIRVGFDLFVDIVSVTVVVRDLLAALVESTGCCRQSWLRHAQVICYHDVHYYVGGVIDDMQALLDGRVYVDVPNCATVDKHVSLEVLGRENEGD